MRYILYLFCVFLHLDALYASVPGAKDDSTQTIGQFLKSDSVFSLRSHKGYVPSLIHNFGEQAISPLHFKSNDFLWLGGVAGVTALLIHYDSRIDQWISPTKSKYGWIDVSSPPVSELGNNYGYALLAGLGIGTAALKEKKMWHTSLLASQAMITSGTWVRLLKYMTSRERPSASYSGKGHPGGYWYGSFKEFSSAADGRNISFFDAFPSGHTSTAFSIAAVFAMQYNETKAVPIIAYTTASLVGVSRMIEHTHWASDVFLGAAIGYLCGKEVVLHYRKLYASPSLSQQLKKTEPVLLLRTSSESNGLALTLQW